MHLVIKDINFKMVTSCLISQLFVLLRCRRGWEGVLDYSSWHLLLYSWRVWHTSVSLNASKIITLVIRDSYIHSSCSIAKQLLYTRWKSTEIPKSTLSKSCRLSLWGYPGWYRIMMLPPCLPWNLSLKCSPLAKNGAGLGKTPASMLQKAVFIPLLLVCGDHKYSLFCSWVVPLEFCFCWGQEPGGGEAQGEQQRGLSAN